MSSLLSRLPRLPRVARALDAVREGPDKVRTVARFSRQTGMMWSMSAPGMIEMARVFLRGAQNPSLVYRIQAKNTPDKPALVTKHRTTTWREIDERIDRLVAGLARHGIGRKKSILLMLKNRQELIEIGAAAARSGASAVSISWRSTAQELGYLAANSGATAIVVEADLHHVVDEAELPPALRANVFVVGGDPVGGARSVEVLYAERPAAFDLRGADDDDAAVVIYTSGTTGKPKGAVRKFPKDTMFAAFRFMNETPMRTDDVHLVTAPLYHSTAFGFLTLSQTLGATIILMDEFKPEPFLELVERHGVTTTAMVPTMLARILDLPRATRQRYDTRTLRAVFAGGAPLPAQLAIDFMDAFGDVVFNFYGATETGLVTLATPRDLREAPGTIGRAVPGNTIRLLDDERREVPEGVGELFVKNALLVTGYHHDEAATKDSMVDGFFSVGDLARRDRDGRYFIEGRKRDMIISGGVNVYPVEVEGALQEHPDVAEVAVVGVPDREWGEKVRAFVVRREGTGVDGEALKAYAKERLMGPKVPRDYVFVDALPRNPTGKVLKKDLRERKIPLIRLPGWLERMFPPGMRRHEVDVGGQRMHVAEWGEGRPVLMVHGNPTWCFLYRKVVAELVGEPFRAIVPDLVGLGCSTKPREESVHTLENHGRWLGAVVDHFSLDDMIFVGQDWGGPIGLHALSSRLSRVRGIVVLNTVPGPPRRGFRPTKFHRFARRPMLSEFVFRVLGFPQNTMFMAQGDKTSIAFRAALAYRWPLRKIADRTAPLALARMVPDSEHHPSIAGLQKCEEALTSFRGPISVVWGDRDPVLGRVIGHVQRLLPHAHVTRTPAGHFLQEEVPVEIAHAIRRVARP